MGAGKMEAIHRRSEILSSYQMTNKVALQSLVTLVAAACWAEHGPEKGETNTCRFGLMKWSWVGARQVHGEVFWYRTRVLVA